VIEVIRARSQGGRDWTMAATRNRLGSWTGTGHTWRAPRVACVREHSRLPNCAKGHEGLTRTPAARPFGVRATVVKRCLAQGPLPARHVVPQAPWSIPGTALALPAVQAVGQGVCTGRRQLGLRLAQPAWPGPACPPAGAA